MTVAQLVHPAYSLARGSGWAPARSLYRHAASLYDRAAHHSKGDADLWRAIGIGLGFAGAGFALLATAVGA